MPFRVLASSWWRAWSWRVESGARSATSATSAPTDKPTSSPSSSACPTTSSARRRSQPGHTPSPCDALARTMRASASATCRIWRIHCSIQPTMATAICHSVMSSPPSPGSPGKVGKTMDQLRHCPLTSSDRAT
ncbi:hypothetical protein D3C72_1129580 [compost metagenome]